MKLKRSVGELFAVIQSPVLVFSPQKDLVLALWPHQRWELGEVDKTEAKATAAKETEAKETEAKAGSAKEQTIAQSGAKYTAQSGTKQASVWALVQRQLKRLTRQEVIAQAQSLLSHWPHPEGAARLINKDAELGAIKLSDGFFVVIGPIAPLKASAPTLVHSNTTVADTISGPDLAVAPAPTPTSTPIASVAFSTTRAAAALSAYHETVASSHEITPAFELAVTNHSVLSTSHEISPAAVNTTSAKTTSAKSPTSLPKVTAAAGGFSGYGAAALGLSYNHTARLAANMWLNFQAERCFLLGKIDPMSDTAEQDFSELSGASIDAVSATSAPCCSALAAVKATRDSDKSLAADAPSATDTSSAAVAPSATDAPRLMAATRTMATTSSMAIAASADSLATIGTAAVSPVAVSSGAVSATTVTPAATAAVTGAIVSAAIAGGAASLAAGTAATAQTAISGLSTDSTASTVSAIVGGKAASLSPLEGSSRASVVTGAVGVDAVGVDAVGVDDVGVDDVGVDAVGAIRATAVTHTAMGHAAGNSTADTAGIESVHSTEGADASGINFVKGEAAKAVASTIDNVGDSTGAGMVSAVRSSLDSKKDSPAANAATAMASAGDSAVARVGTMGTGAVSALTRAAASTMEAVSLAANSAIGTTYLAHRGMASSALALTALASTALAPTALTPTASAVVKQGSSGLNAVNLEQHYDLSAIYAAEHEAYNPFDGSSVGENFTADDEFIASLELSKISTVHNHNQMRNELVISEAVRMGDVERLKWAYSISPKGKAGILGVTPLRSWQNHAHLQNVLSSRAAIAAGLSVEDAYTLSDKLFLAVENITDPLLAKHMRYIVARIFTEKVKLYQEACAQEGISVMAPELVQQARYYIHQHLLSSLCLEDIATELGCSKEHLARTFQRYMHQGVMEYVRSERLKLAKELLLESNNKIKDIAALLGFASSAHFCHAFKSVEHLTPAQWRKQHSN